MAWETGPHERLSRSSVLAGWRLGIMALVVALMFLGPLFLYRFFDVTRSSLTDQHRVREA